MARIVPTLTPNEQHRLWSGICVGGLDECWEWRWSCTSHGYGQMELRRELQRQNWQTHVLVYAQLFEHIPGLDVMHSCDNRKCCNPIHLSQGTRQENMQDASRKGRMDSIPTATKQRLLELIEKGYAVGAAARFVRISKTHAHRLVGEAR